MVRSCTCTFPSADADRPGFCESCGGRLAADASTAALAEVGQALRGLSLRLQALEQQVAEGATTTAKATGALRDDIAELRCYVKPAAGAEPWMNASETAAWLGKSLDYVRDHADELGVERGGTGPRARLMFKRSRVEQGLAAMGRGSK